MTTRGVLVVVGGPTASGKTNAAASLARHYGTEVISADSRQFYHAMRIGTARPDEAELLGVPHHFLGHLDLEETWSAGTFARKAEPVLNDLLERNRIAVLVGGSGLYIDALIKGLDPLPGSDVRLRDKLQDRLQREGLASLVKELDRLDPEMGTTIDRNNPHRVIRALEITLVTGIPFSRQRTTPKDRLDIHIVRLAMDLPRKALYERIDSRVDRMFADGLAKEARSLLPFQHLNALRTVGYRELFAHFAGGMDLDPTVDLIKQHTRNYAKRQLTWFRKGEQWRSVPPTDLGAMITIVDEALARG